MDSESSIDHERLYDDGRHLDRRWFQNYTQKPEWISYGLLALLYVLILALFITVFSGANVRNKQLVTLKDMNDFRGKEKICETGWKQFDETCYFLTVFKATWSTTRKSCLMKEADLAVITSEREQIFLTTFSDASSSKRYWIGLHDMDDEGTWIWVDGTNYETSYKKWKKGEPNDYDANEDCAHLWSFGEWNDTPCDYEYSYGICEKKL